jgi:hypothetical protein
MSVESRKVLDMLAEGKITPEQADKLLEKLSSPQSAEAKPEESSSASSRSSSSSSSKPRFLRIVVDKPGQEQVNVRMPLAFARKGTHLLAVLPERIREKLAEQGIDLQAAAGLNDKEWADAIENMNVDIDKGNGKKVRIFCE